MSKKTESNIANFAKNHFGTEKGKVPVQVFVMQIHDEEDNAASK